jgi:hypothetical protein
MDTPEGRGDPRATPPAAATDARLPQAWGELLQHMQEVHARLEYLRLMLRLNQRQP